MSNEEKIKPICRNCRHHQLIFDPCIKHSDRCSYGEETKYNPISGRMEFEPDGTFPACFDLNKGSCKNFEESKNGEFARKLDKIKSIIIDSITQ